MAAVGVIKGTVTISAILLLTTFIIRLMIAAPAPVIHHDSSVESPDPEINLKLSLQVTMNQLSDISARLKKLNESRSEIEESLSRLISFETEDVDVGSGEKMMLTDRKVTDFQTWIGAAVSTKTDEVDTCSESEMGSPVFDGVLSEMQKTKEIMSDCLDIIANIQTHLREKLGRTKH